MRNIILVIYKAIWVFLFRVKNACFTLWFRFLLWLNKVSFGKHCQVSGGIPQIRISFNTVVSIGDNAKFNNYTDVAWYSVSSLWVRRGAVLKIGDNFGINGGLICVANKIVIGSNVKIGGGTKIFDTDFHPVNFEDRRFSDEQTKTAPVVIGDDVFVGTSCLILKGVTIGARSVIAAGSVVTHNVPPDEIWGGNPARFIKSAL